MGRAGLSGIFTSFWRALGRTATGKAPGSRADLNWNEVRSKRAALGRERVGKEPLQARSNSEVMRQQLNATPGLPPRAVD